MTKYTSKKILSSRLGGLRRIELYGNPGTEEGRRKGGKISALKANKNPNFKQLRTVSIPFKNEQLAELIGIFFGDGHLSYYQASVTLNNEDDDDYIDFVGSLTKDIFNVIPGYRNRRLCKATDIVLSSRMIVTHLSNLGMPNGNKLQKGLSIPLWIMKRKLFLAAFLRGVFDTDGSLYKERKKVKSKEYFYPCISISSALPLFICEIQNALAVFGIESTTSSNNAVLIRKRRSIQLFMEKIGSHNKKHLTKYDRILELATGNVA